MPTWSRRGAGLPLLLMVGCHAFCLAVVGRYTEKLRVAYSLFYVVGTIGAILVPVVGWRPLKDMELLPPLLVFVGLQVQAPGDGVHP